MKLLACWPLCLTALVQAASLLGFNGNGQLPITVDQLGFSLDLNEQRLVQLSYDGEPVWMTELDKIDLKAKGIGFFDITETPDLGSLNKASLNVKHSLPTSPNASELVKPALAELSTEGPKENLAKFSSFRTRHYRSEAGKQSQQWLLKTIGDITTETAPTELKPFVTVTEFTHPWGQNSVIARINGSSDDDSLVIIGAHQDSTNYLPFMPAPGADDDGSGSVTILEAYRAIIATGFRPVRSIEFQWYAAEEGGLLGSQAVAHAYEVANVDVLAMIQFDMTAWVKAGTEEEVGIITGHDVDTDLTNFTRKLVDAYLDIPWINTKYPGTASTDHASWYKAGYTVASVLESTFENANPNVHSTRDRIDTSPEFSFEHMLQFSKLAAAFAIELGSWAGSD